MATSSQEPSVESRSTRARFQPNRAAATAAAEYFRAERLPERLEDALNSAFRLQPEDLPGYLCSFLSGFCKPARISGLRARKVLDGAGGPTLEVDVECALRNTQQRICSAVISADSAPSCDSTYDAKKERMMGVETAIQWTEESIGPLLRGIQPDQQSKIDQLLSDFIKPKIEEEWRRRDAERDAAAPPTTCDPTPPPTSPTAGKKRGSGKGKKASAPEKPLPPAEPPEPVVRGSLAVAAVSLAVASCAAALQPIPLYSYISTLRHTQMPEKLRMPLPLITVLSCGKSSPGKLNLVKELLIIPKPGLTAQQGVDLALALQNQILKQMDGAAGKSGQGAQRSVSVLGCPLLAADRPEQPLELVGDACRELGLQLGDDVHLAINCGAPELMDYNKSKYEILSGALKSPEEMVAFYADFINRHPAVTALLDPLRREDRAQWEMLGKAIGSRCYLLEEDASKSISSLLQGPNTSNPPLESGGTPTSSGTVLKYTNETTISDLLKAVQLIEGEQRVVIQGCTQEESSSDLVVDLAVGLGTQFIKLGGLLRGERSSKYNRLLAVEEELQQRNMLEAPHTQFDFPALWSDPQEEVS